MENQLIALISFALVATGSPGGATSLATASGARFGYRRSLPLIFGIATALAALVSFSGGGLSALMYAFPSLELILKLLGSAYLVTLAIMIARAGKPEGNGGKRDVPFGFVAGALLLIINPKAWAMAVGVAASFSSISDNGAVVVSLFGSVFFICAALSLTLWAQLGSLLGKLLKTDLQWRVFNVLMAVLLMVSILTLWL